MNPLTKVKLINELNEREVQLGVAEKVSWHSEYKDSAWIFLGGLPYELTEGDIICVFSQYGEIVNINLVRDKKTGKSKGFCFLCYEDQRSTVLAVDNFNGIKIKGRTIRVDHVSNYRAPQESEDVDDVTRELQEKGCGAKTPPSSSPEVSEDEDVKPIKKHKKVQDSGSWCSATHIQSGSSFLNLSGIITDTHREVCLDHTLQRRAASCKRTDETTAHLIFRLLNHKGQSL